MTEETKNIIVWQSDSTHPELSEVVKASLREVMDPELGLNIMELGLVRDLQIEEDKAKVTMIMTTPFCPYAPALLEMTRKQAESTLNRPTSIEMGREMSAIVKSAADKNISFYEAERQVLDFHHGQVGRWLAEHWNLPVNLAEPINFHHQPELAKIAPEQTAIVHLANIIIRARGFGFSGDRFVPPLSPHAWDLLGFAPEDFDGILEDLEPKLMNIE